MLEAWLVEVLGPTIAGALIVMAGLIFAYVTLVSALSYRDWDWVKRRAKLREAKWAHEDAVVEAMRDASLRRVRSGDVECQ